VFLVVRRNECGEGHPVENIDVVVLVGAVPGTTGGLDLQHGPPVLPEENKVRHALLVVRVVLQDDAAREKGAQLLDETSLELSFEH
jgi:hypothetical protein